MDIGYCRVSMQGRTLESQIEQIQKAGCSKIHSEKASGIGSDRAELRSLINP
jgi:DNA invertase Pin-like site-specific DNA recombinase